MAEENNNPVSLGDLGSATPDDIREALRGQPSPVQDEEALGDKPAGTQLNLGQFNNNVVRNEDGTATFINPYDSNLSYDLDQFETQRRRVSEGSMLSGILNGVEGLEENFMYTGMQDTARRSEEAQGVVNKMKNGMTQLVADTGINVAQGFASLLYGVPSAIVNGDLTKLYDNAVANGLDRGTEFLDEFYKIKRGGNQSGMQRAANFLFDDVAGAASFVMGAVATELAFTALTAATLGGAAPAQAAATAGLVARGTRLVNKAINGGKYLMAGRFVDDALRGAQQLAANATRANAAQALRSAGQAIARPQAMQAAARLSRQLITGASMESGMEARHMLNAAVEDHKRQYEDLYGEGTFTDEMGEQFRSEISGHADGVFGLNMALVAGSNILMFPKLFGVGLRRGMRSAKFIDTSTLSAKARARLAKNLGVTEGALPKMVDAARGGVLGRVVGRGGVTARTIQKNLGNAFYEGFVEEGGQGAISRTAEDYISKRYDPAAVNQSARYVDSFLEGLKGSYMTGDGFKEIGIGALMAFTGVPMYVRANRVNKDGEVQFNEDGTAQRQWKLQMMGGYVDARAEVLAQDKKMQDIINLNEKYGDVGGIVRAEVENMHRQNALQREQDIAIGENDFKRAKDIESDMMFSHAASKIVTGRYDQAIGEASQVLEEMTEDEMREQLGENAANMTDEEVRQHKQKVLESYKRRMELARKAYENATDVYRGSDRDITTGVAHMLYNIDELDAREKRIAEMMAESIEGYNMEQVLDLAKIQAEGDLTDAQLQDILKRVNQLKDIEKQLKTKRERNIISNIDPEKAAARQAEIAELQEKQAEGLQYLQDLWDTVALSNNADRTKYAFNIEFLEDLAKLHSVISTQNRDVINRQEDIQRQFENLVDVAADRLNMIDMYNDFISPGGVERFENRLRDTIERLADMTPEERIEARQEEAAQQDLEAAEAANLTEEEGGVPQTPGAEAAPESFSDSGVGAEAAPYVDDEGIPGEAPPPEDYGFPPGEQEPTYAEEFDVPDNVMNPEGGNAPSQGEQQQPTQPTQRTEQPVEPTAPENRGPETAENTPSNPVGTEQAPNSFSDPGMVEPEPYIPEDAGMLEPEPTYDENNIDSEGKGLPGEPVDTAVPPGAQGTPVDEVDNTTNAEAPVNIPPSQPGPTTVYGEMDFAPLINARYGRRMVRSQHEAFVRKVMEEGLPAGTKLKAKILDRNKGMFDIMTEDNVLIDRVVDPNNKAILNGIEKNGFIPLVVAEDVQFHLNGGEKVRANVNGKVVQVLAAEYTKLSEVLPNGIKDVVGAGVASTKMLMPVGGMENIDAYVPTDSRFAGNGYVATRDARDGHIAYHSIQLAQMGMKRSEQLIKTITVANKFLSTPNALTVEERNLLNAFAKAGNIDLNGNSVEVMKKIAGRLQRSVPQGPLSKQTEAVFAALDRGIQPRPKFTITLDKRNNTIKIIAVVGRAADGKPVMIHSHTATGLPRGSVMVDLTAKLANQRINLIQENDLTVLPDGNGGFKAYRQSQVIEEFASFSDRMPYVRNGKVYNRLPDKLVYRSEVLTEVPRDNTASQEAQEAIIEGEKPVPKRETLTDTFDFTDDTYNDAGFDNDYLPQEAPSTSEIDAKDPLARAGALYEVKGLTPREIRDGINFSAGVMSKAFMVHIRTVQRKEAITARYLRDRVRNEMEGQLENLQAQRPSAVRDKMIEAYTHWLQPAHFTRLMDLSLVEMLRQSKGIIELRAGNLDKAIDKLGEEELSVSEEDDANDAERKENPMAAFDDNFAFGTDPKSTLRLEAKMLLMGLQHRVTPATINPNNFGLAGPRFMDQADLQNKINAACAGVEPSFEKVHQRLRDFSFTYPEFRTVLDALTDDSAVRQIPQSVKAQGEAQYEKIVKKTKNLQKQIRQQFTTFAIKEETTWESANIVTAKEGQSEMDAGTPSDIQIFNSNQRNMREFVKADIQGILVQNKFFTSSGKLNKPKFKRVVEALDDIAKAPESDRKLMLSKVLQREFGITIDPAAFSSSNMTGNANGRPFFFGLEQELGNVNMHSNYYGLMRKALRDVAEKDVSLEDFIADSSETGIDPPGKHVINFFVGLADYRTNFIQNSSKDGDNKLRWHYSMPKLLHQLLRDAVYGEAPGVLRKRLSGLRVSPNQGIDDRTLVKISYLSGIKMDGKGKERGFHDMELGDQAIAQLAFYGNRGANRYDGRLLLGKFFMPTLADKHTMPIVQMPTLSASNVKFNLDPKLMHADPSKLTIQHVIKNLPTLYDLTMRDSVQVEVNRILRLHAADYEGMSASQRKAWGFMMMPQLNYFAEELRANRIKRVDFEKQVHLAATKHFIASVDNDFKEMLKQLEGTVYTYNQRQVVNRDNTVTDYKEITVPSQFNIANRNFHWMGMHIDPTMDKSEYNKPGMSQAAFLAFIGKYVIDAHSARTGLTMDILGDPGAFAKTKRDGTVNVGKSLATMSKRFASFIAPGTAIPYVDWSYVENGKMVTKNNRMVRSLMIPARIVSKAAHWDYLEKLGQTPDQLAMQEGYDSADGAEWTTAEEHLSTLFAQGQISESDMVGILKKLQRNQKLDEAELGWFQAMKPVTTGRIGDHLIYVKSASFPLVPQLTAGTELDKLREFMEKNNIQRAAYDSAVKVGNEWTDQDDTSEPEDRRMLSVHNGSEVVLPEGLENRVISYDRRFMRIQQPVPVSKTTQKVHGSQVAKLLFVDLADAVFSLNGLEYKGKELYKKYIYHRKAELNARMELFGLQYGMERRPDGKWVHTGASRAKFAERIMEEAIARNYDANEIAALHYDYEKGDFSTPLISGPSQDRIENLVKAVLFKEVYEPMTEGYSGPIRPEVGLGVVDEKILNDSNVVWVKRGGKRVFNGKLQVAKGDKPDQILMPWKYKAKLDKFLDKEGNINAEDLPAELLNTFAYRIPGQRKSSSASFEIVGFLPKEYGDTLIVNEELVGRIGQDYDIDKMFGLLYTVEQDKDGNISIIRDELEGDAVETVPTTVTKIISGGQTGADRMGLEVAAALGVATGGMAPKGYKTERGADTSLKNFGLEESESADYKERTTKNIQNSDATVIFAENVTSPGTKFTVQAARKNGKPIITNPTVEELQAFMRKHNVSVLNVAGNRASKMSSEYLKKAQDTLTKALQPEEVKVYDSQNKKIAAENALPATDVKDGVKELFESNPELASIATPEEYSAYLDSLFPDSKVKDIVYHAGWKPEGEKFDVGKSNDGEFGKGIYFTPSLQSAIQYAAIMGDAPYITKAIVNLKNPVVFGDEKPRKGESRKYIRSKIAENPNNDGTLYQPTEFTEEEQLDYGVDAKQGHELKVNSAEQILVLGSKEDIEGFKKFVSKKSVSQSSIAAEKRKIAIHRNAQLDIYIASMRSKDKKVQRAVHAPVTDGYAEQLAEQIAESETKMFLPMSMAYSNMKSEAARSAKRSIGVFASQNVFHSQLEQVLESNSRMLRFSSFANYVAIQDTPDGKKYFMDAIGLPDIHDDTFLFKYSINGKAYTPKAGLISDQFSRLLNHAVDNENNGLLGKLAITQDTWPIWISMTHMGYNQETITMFSRMPIIQEYLQAKSQTRRLGSKDRFTAEDMLKIAASRLSPELQAEIEEKGAYFALRDHGAPPLNKQDMYEVFMGTSAKTQEDKDIFQYQIMDAMMKMEALNGDIQLIQKLLRLDTNRPKTIAEMEAALMDIEKIQKKVAEQRDVCMTLSFNDVMYDVATKTVGGMITNNVANTAANMFALETGYDEYRRTLRSAIKRLEQGGQTYQIGDKANTLIKGLKSVAYAKFTEHVFGRTVGEMRDEMHNVNTGGIARRMIEMRETKPEIANNVFIKQILAVDKPGKYPHLEFTGDRALETNPLDMHRAFLSLLKSKDPEVKEFAEYLAAYALVSSNGRLKSRGFMKFIPHEWLDSKGISEFVNNTTISKEIDSAESVRQVIRHNPDLAPKYFNGNEQFRKHARFQQVNGETLLLVDGHLARTSGHLQVGNALFSEVGTVEDATGELLFVHKYVTPLGDYLLDEYSPSPIPFNFQPRPTKARVAENRGIGAPPPSMMDVPPPNAHDEAAPYTDRGDGTTTPTYADPGFAEREPDYVQNTGIPAEAPPQMVDDSNVGAEMEPDYVGDPGYGEKEPTYDENNIDSEGKGLPGEPMNPAGAPPVQDKVVNQIQREENTLIGVHEMDTFFEKFPQYSGIATAWMKKMVHIDNLLSDDGKAIRVEVVEGPTVAKFIRSEKKLVISKDKIGDPRVVMHELMHALTNTGFNLATMPRPEGIVPHQFNVIKNSVQGIEHLLKSAVTPGSLEKMGLNWADYQRTIRGYRGYVARRNGQPISEETASDIEFLLENRDKYYGFVNAREFVSELFSNKQFAEQLAKLETGTNQTWLEKFISAIEDVLVALGMDKSFAKSGLAAEVYGHAMNLTGASIGNEGYIKTDANESYLVEDFLVESAMAPDVEGYTYKGIAELKAYKKKRIRQFQELRSRYKDNREYVRRVNARLAQEEKELERLNDDSVPISPDYVLAIGQRELDLARRTISNVNGTARSVGMALSSLENVYSIIDFYDQAREIMSNPVLRDVATELRRDAAELRDNYLEKARQILRADAMGTFSGTGVDINSDTFDTLQQTGFMKSRFLDASRQGLTELSYLDKIVRDAAHKQRVEFNKRAKAYLDKSNAFKKTAYFKKYGWEGMVEKDKRGNATSKIITMFSGAFEAERKIKYGQLGNGKQYYDWLDSVTERVDVNTAFDYSGDTVTRKNNPAYKNYLEGKFGVGGAQELLRQQETVLQEYIDARESAFDNIEMTEDRATWDAKKAEWVAKHDPGSKYEQIRGRRQGVRGSTRRYLVDFPLREVNGRDTGYYDARFSELMQEKEAMEFYTEYRKQITELGRMLPSHKLNRHERLIQNGLFVPAMSKTLMSDLMTKDGLMQAVTKLPDHIKAAMTIESKTDINQLIDPTTGRPRQELPVYFTGEVDPETQEYDLDRTFLAFAMMSTAYDSKNAIEDKVRMTRSVLNNARVKAESGPTATLLEKAGIKLEAGLKDAVALDSIMKSVDTVVDTFYGYQETRDYTTDAPDWMWTNEQKEKIEKLQEELLGAQSEEAQERIQAQIDEATPKLSAAKSGRMLQQMTQAKGMAWNIPGAIVNFIFGSASVMKHAAGRRDFSEKDSRKAFGIMTHSTLNQLTLNTGLTKTNTSRKIQNMMINLDVLKDYTEIRYDVRKFDKQQTESGINASVQQGINKLRMYEIQRSSEYFVYGQGTIAHLLSVEVDGKSLWEHMDDNGIIQLDGYRPGEEKHLELMSRIDQINKRIHGNYDPNSPLAIKKTVLGPLLMQFRSWLPEAIASRFEQEKYDPYLERTVKGTFQTMFFSGEIGKHFKAMLPMLLPSFIRSKGLDTLPDDISEIDQENIRKFGASLQQWLGILLTIAMLNALKDDEDDEESVRVLNFGLNIASRLKNDLTLFGDPRAMIDMTQGDMLAIVGYMVDVMAFGDAVVDTIGGEGEITTGVYAGKSKMLHHGGKLIPHLNSVQRIQNMMTRELG